MAKHDSDRLFAAGAEMAEEAAKMPLQYLGSILKSFFRDDGSISAALRQGSDEIGQALKAFPDSIQSQEMGAFWGWPDRGMCDDGGLVSPGEIAASRDTEAKPQRVTPNDIAEDRDQAQGPSQTPWEDKIRAERERKSNGEGGNDQNERGKGRSLPEEERQRERDRDRGR